MRMRNLAAVAALFGGLTAAAAMLLGRRSDSVQKDADALGREALIDEASLESFPASDPPPWTLGEERRDD